MQALCECQLYTKTAGFMKMKPLCCKQTRLSPLGVFASKVCASAKGQVEFVKAN